MKKFGKFVFTTVSIAAAIGGVVYFVKNVMNKDNTDDFDDFDDFDDDFEDFDLDTEEEQKITDANREYVTLSINSEASAEDTSDADTESESEEVDEEETTEE